MGPIPGLHLAPIPTLSSSPQLDRPTPPNTTQPLLLITTLRLTLTPTLTPTDSDSGSDPTTGPESIPTLALNAAQSYSNPYRDPYSDFGIGLDRDPDTNYYLTLTATLNPTSIKL